MTSNDDPRLNLQRGFIAALALSLSAIFLYMIRDYLTALFLAGVLAVFLYPLQSKLTDLFGGRKGPAAGVVMVVAIFVVLIPLLALLVLVAQQAVDVSQTVIPWAQEQIRNFRAEGLAGLPDWLPFRDALVPYQSEIAQRLTEAVSGLGGVVIGGLTRAGGGALSFMLNAVVLLFALYYLLTSGQSSLKTSMDLLPMRPKDRDLLLERTYSTIKATVKGTFVIAIVQGVLTGLALAVAGVPGAAFWGAVAGILSVIPGIGPPLVWAPAAIWLYVSGSPAYAIGLAVWGAGVVGVIDNLLRPILVGQDAKMSDLLVLLSTLGGLALVGAVGIIVGPLIAALFTSAWFIYARSYRDLLAERGVELTEEPSHANAEDPPANS